jgi:hypothetical protein
MNTCGRSIQLKVAHFRVLFDTIMTLSRTTTMVMGLGGLIPLKKIVKKTIPPDAPTRAARWTNRSISRLWHMRICIWSSMVHNKVQKKKKSMLDNRGTYVNVE